MSDDWMDERLSLVPAALRRALSASVPHGTDAASLAQAATEALRRAGGRPERDAAYDLLAADALITYACERAASAPDPEATLVSILEAVLEVEP